MSSPGKVVCRYVPMDFCSILFFETVGFCHDQIRLIMAWLSVQELSTDGICTEVDQKKEVGELTGTSITKSGSGVYEEKEQLQESSATEEVGGLGSCHLTTRRVHCIIVSTPSQELYLMDGITDLSASIRKMIDVANSEPPPQAEDDEGIAVVVNTPPSQTVAQPSSERLISFTYSTK